MLNFCFAKSHLRVWDHIWEKSGRKVNHIVGKTWNLFLSKTTTLPRKLATKVRNSMGHLFRHTTRSFFKVTYQQNINMMCKIREYDASWSCLKMLNFGSKTLKMFEFIRWIDLLLRDIQYFVFRKNALFRFRFDEFTWPQDHGTPKFWPKISHSEKSVDFLLKKSQIPSTSKLSAYSERVMIYVTHVPLVVNSSEIGSKSQIYI